MPAKKKTAKIQKKQNRIEPALPGGFLEYGPADAILRSEMLKKVRTVFERFGFDPMETPAVERREVLVGGDAESEKIIFAVAGSREKKSDAALRFDLTVPLARFIAAASDIPKPFKRYQIGNVWRGESPQAGRYREFMQADIDIVGVKSLEADAEIITVIYATLRSLGFSAFTIKYNFRSDAASLLDRFGVAEARRAATLIAVDKKDKLDEKKFAAEVKRASGLSAEKLTAYLGALSSAQPGADGKRLEALAAEQGVAPQALVYNASMVRGLGYYTGAIFEAVPADAPGIGSVFSGGRYDNLTLRFSPQAIPAVGASLGFDRLFAALARRGAPRKQTATDILILNLLGSAGAYSRMRSELMRAGFNTAVYLGDDRAFQAQLAYAVKKEIPYVVICGEKEKAKGVALVKNLATREQTEVGLAGLAQYFKDLRSRNKK